MAGLTGALTGTLISMLSSTSNGVSVRIGAMKQADASIGVAGIRSVVELNASVDLSEKAGFASYPSLLVYCDKLTNSLKEKYRQFSGKAHLVIEVRNSQDLLESLEANTQVYADAICAMLDDSRGDWGNGAFYAGGYDVAYEPVVRGGKNFLQKAKVGFDLEVSK